MIFLMGERIILRSLLQSDVDTMLKYRNDPECSRFQRYELKSRDDLSVFISKMSSNTLFVSRKIFLAIARKDSEEMLGEMAVLYDNGCVTLGYTIASEHQRQGYAYEAISLFLDAHFKRFPSVSVICRVAKENTASIRLLQKLSFEDCGYDKEKGTLIFKKTKPLETKSHKE